MARARSEDSSGTAATHGDDPSLTGTRSVRWHLVTVGIVFFGLRIVLWSTGLRFHDRLQGQLQLLDEPVLTARPFLAFTENGIQPPLWNFYVGAVRAWSPFPAAATFQVVWVVASAATVFMLWDVLTGLGARRWQATVAAIFVACNPLLISSESFLRYETAVTFLVTASVFTFARFVATPRLRGFVLFGAVLLVGVSTRTILNPAWLLAGVVGACLVARRSGNWSGRLLWPAVLVPAIMVGNLAFLHHRFGSVGYSSYSGVNLERIAVTTLPEATLRRLQNDGTVSALASVKPYSPFEAYVQVRPDLAECRSTRGASTLSRLRKSTREPNLAASCFAPVYRQALDDALAAIRADPGNYLRSVGQGTALFVSWTPPIDKVQTRSFDVLETLYKPFLLPVHVSYDVGGSDPQPTTAFMMAGLSKVPMLLTMAVALVYAVARGAAAAFRLVGRRARTGDETLTWIGVTVLAVSVVSVAFDFYENARFRIALDPILLGPLVVAVTSVVRQAALALRARIRDQGVGPAGS